MPRPATRPFDQRMFKGEYILKALNNYLFETVEEEISDIEFMAAYDRAVLQEMERKRDQKPHRKVVHDTGNQTSFPWTY